MDPRSFAGAWGSTVARVRANDALLLPVAAAFFFLPQLMLRRLVGDPLAQAQAGTLGFGGLFIVFAVALAGLLGQLTITRLLLGAPGEETLGEALSRIWPLLLPAVAALILQSLAIGAGLLLLILPGLYLAGRLLFVLPLLVDRSADPLAAIKASWQLSTDNGLRLMGQLAALFLGFLLLSFLVNGLGSALGVLGTVAGGQSEGDGWGVGRWLFEMAGVALSAAFLVHYLAFAVSLYRAYR